MVVVVVVVVVVVILVVACISARDYANSTLSAFELPKPLGPSCAAPRRSRAVPKPRADWTHRVSAERPEQRRPQTSAGGSRPR